MKNNINFTYLVILFALIITSCNTDVVIENEELSIKELSALKSLGLNEETVELKGDDIIIENDIALNRKKLKEYANKTQLRSTGVAPSNVPKTSQSRSISVYKHPSFDNAPLICHEYLEDAIHYINGLPHSAVHLYLSNSIDSDITIVLDNTTDPEVPDVMKNIGGLGLAYLALGEEFGSHISLNDQWLPPHHFSKPKIDGFIKMMIHEFKHTLGFGHNCAEWSTTVNFFTKNTIETTSNNNWNEANLPPPYECDSTSVMFPWLTSYINGISTIFGSPNPVLFATEMDEEECEHYSKGYYHYMNVNDTFAVQAFYPCTYDPFEVEISDCEITKFPQVQISSTPHGSLGSQSEVLLYHLNYIQNDFVPYEITFDLYKGNVLVASKTEYRYWNDHVYFDIKQNNLNQYLGDCLHLNVGIRNWKGDMKANSQTDCCIPN